MTPVTIRRQERIATELDYYDHHQSTIIIRKNTRWAKEEKTSVVVISMSVCELLMGKLEDTWAIEKCRLVQIFCDPISSHAFSAATVTEGRQDAIKARSTQGNGFSCSSSPDQDTGRGGPSPGDGQHWTRAMDIPLDYNNYTFVKCRWKVVSASCSNTVKKKVIITIFARRRYKVQSKLVKLIEVQCSEWLPRKEKTKNTISTKQ